MVQVNLNIWGEKRIVASTPSSIGADGSVVIGAPKPVDVATGDVENYRNIVPGQKTYILIHGFDNSGGNEKIITNLNHGLFLKRRLSAKKNLMLTLL